ncbi:MAG: M42 family metallopeptidase [bacterium]
MDKTAQLLKELTEAHGVPGHESEVRALLRDHLEELGEVTQDKLGSLLCRQEGDGPRVMLAGHMDEIGFMVQHITKEGFVKFLPLGGWWDQVLLGHRVVIKSHQGDVTGVIGAKPPHLLESEERDKVVKKRDMFIDVGATSREEVQEMGVRVGDPVVPQSEFAVLSNGNTYLSKAFDNRIGCAVVLDVLRNYAGDGERPNELHGVMTVMEEVGVRGATTSVRAVDPQVAIVLESDIAGDVPGIEDEVCDIRLGAGPSVLVYDARMIPNLKLRNLVVDTAEAEDIPLQFSAIQGGATDGAAIHLHNTGVPTVVIGVPARHIHSHGAIIHHDDYERAVRLVTAVVSRLDADTVAGLTE